MAVIQIMPNEILIGVFSHLYHQDLLATSLVSHTFHTLSQSPLYQEPHLRIDDLPRYDSFPSVPIPQPEPGQEAVALFLRTLLLAPGRDTLARYVKGLCVDLNVDRGRVTPNATTDLLRKAASNLGFDDHPLSDQGAQIVMILRLLPQLTTLELRARDGQLGYGYEQVKASIMGPGTIPIGLQNIHLFTSLLIFEGTCVTPMILLALLRLPSIRRIAVSIGEDHSETEMFMTAAALAAGTSLVTQLEMNIGDLRPKTLKTVLKIPKALTSFLYCVGGMGYGMEDLTQFGRALAPLQESLEHLDLHFADMPSECDFLYGVNTIGTFRGWVNLRTLKMQLASLVGEPRNDLSLANLLPQGLSSLFVRDNCYWTGSDLVDQLTGALRQGALVALRMVTVVVTWEYLPAEMEERLRCAYREAGVELVLDIDRSGALALRCGTNVVGEN